MELLQDAMTKVISIDRTNQLKLSEEMQNDDDIVALGITSIPQFMGKL